jgi:hypothetical protein
MEGKSRSIFTVLSYNLVGGAKEFQTYYLRYDILHSISCSQEPGNELYREPDESNPNPDILLLRDLFQYCLPTLA